MFCLYCGDFHASYMKASNLMHLKKIRKCKIAIECALIRKRYMKYPKYSLFCITHLVSKTIFDQRSIFLIISLKIRIRIKIRIPFMTIAGANIFFFLDVFAVEETLPRRRYEFLSDHATGSFTRRSIDRVVVFEAKHASNTTLHEILNLRTIQSHAVWK